MNQEEPSGAMNDGGPSAAAAAPGRVRSRMLAAIGISALAQLATALLCEWRPASYDEGLMWRWLRVVADHPWRSGIALCLAVAALRWPARDAPPAGSAPPW